MQATTYKNKDPPSLKAVYSMQRYKDLNHPPKEIKEYILFICTYIIMYQFLGSSWSGDISLYKFITLACLVLVYVVNVTLPSV